MVTGSGKPAFGFAITGTLHLLQILSRIGAISSGPKEQLRPIASAFSPSSVRIIASGETPWNVLPFSSKLIVQRTGLSLFSLQAKSAVFISSKSVIVSIAITSYLSSAVTISLKISYASSDDKVPLGWSSWPIGPISSATKASVPSTAFSVQSRAAFTTSLTP